MPSPYENLLNQINRTQARHTIIAALSAGGLTAIAVLSADLPKIVDATSPLGMALLTVIGCAQWFLNTGKK
jgi:hypothetical protein